MSENPEHRDDTRPDITALEYEKRRVDLQKTKAELHDVTLSWWKRPAYIAALTPVPLALLAMLAAWGTGLFDRERAALKDEIDILTTRRDTLQSQSALIETKNRQLEAQLTDHHDFVGALDGITDVGGAVMTWAEDGQIAYMVSFESRISELLDIADWVRPFYDLPETGTTSIDQALSELQHLRNVQYVFIDGDAFTVTDNGLRSLENVPSLRALGLRGARFDDESVRIISRLKHLQHLHLSTEFVTDKAIEHVTRLPKLRSLTVQSERLTDEGVARVAAFQELEALAIATRQLDKQGMQGIARLTTLDKLLLVAVFGSAELQEISTLSNLRSLDLSVLEDSRLEWLGPFQMLEDLRLEFKWLTVVDDPAPITALSELETLSLENCSLQSVDGISDLKQLRVFVLTNAEFPHAVGTAIIEKASPTLECLSLMGTPVSDSDLKKIGRYRGMKVLRLDNTHVTDTALKHIRQLPSLQELSLSGTSVTAEGLRKFAKEAPDVIVLGEGNMQPEDPVPPTPPTVSP